MDNKPRLPSITTHFAEYFPDHRANTAPVTPPGAFPGRVTSIKRKRSDPTDGSGELPPKPTKQPFSGSSSGLSDPSRIYLSDSEMLQSSAREYRYRPDSSRGSESAASAYPRFSYSPLKLDNAERAREKVYEPEGRSASISTLASSSLNEKPSRISKPEESHATPSRLLPPISGLEPPPKSSSSSSSRNDIWKGPWQYERPVLPPVIEPRTQYQPLERGKVSEAEPRSAQSNKRRRSSSFDRPVGEIKTPRRPAHGYHYSAESAPYSRLQDPLSPTNLTPRAGNQHPIQSIPSQPRPWERGTASQQTSPTDPSPTSATRSIEPSTRYSWDAPSLYDNMRSIRKRRGNLPKESTALLNEWYNQHASYPYPKEAEKQELQARTGLAMSQISNWFINARRRRRPSASSRTAEGLPRSLAFDFSARKD